MNWPTIKIKLLGCMLSIQILLAIIANCGVLLGHELAIFVKCIILKSIKVNNVNLASVLTVLIFIQAVAISTLQIKLIFFSVRILKKKKKLSKPQVHFLG